jgi:arsenate reductase
MIIYYNARCSKCREALSLLEQNKCEVSIREYLKTPPTQKELSGLLKKLGCQAEAIVRRSEALYREKYAGKTLSNAQWIKVLAENPVLIERPIVVNGEKAVIGRPPVLVLDLIK